MSHVVNLSVCINSLDALEAAAKSIGLELVRDQTSYRWFGRSVGDYPIPEGFTAADMGKCEHALRIPGRPGAYEIGVVRRRDGKPGYLLQWDFWNGGYGLEKVAGKDCRNLTTAYNKEVIRRRALAQGKRVLKTEVRPDGWTVISVGR